MDQGAQAEASGSGAIEDALDLSAVGESDRLAGRVKHQLSSEVASDLALVLQ